LPSREMARELVRVARGGIDPRRKAWKRWRSAQDYLVRLRGFDPDRIAVHAAPYTRGAGLLLWGFSCDARRGDDGAFVIFLNTAHQPGAIAATVAHELGHYIHRSILGRTEATSAPLAADFASHLDDPAELFSDSLAALSAFPQVRSGELAEAIEFIDRDYRIDFAGPGLGDEWRIRYLASTVHMFKLRGALLETAGV